ncbi:rim15, signal transduction response regulator [Coemansia sp. BCRC 34301]|nr:rim15, signal transduction response regulator [Coemansia sp. BCRC 34301]
MPANIMLSLAKTAWPTVVHHRQCLPSSEAAAHQQQHQSSDVLVREKSSDTAAAATGNTLPIVSHGLGSVRTAPQPINIHLHDSGDRPLYHDKSADSPEGSMGALLDIGDQYPSSMSVSASSFSAMRGRTAHHPGSHIRTCPIPERLRLQLRDTGAHDSTDSSSPTITSSSYSARTPTDSPRTLHGAVSQAPLARRRGTLGAGGGMARRSPKDLDTVASPQALPATHSPRAGKAVIPLARRTSSNYSSWSMATPTPTYSTADGAAAGTTVPGDHGMLPDWETADQQQPLSASANARSRSRRYSVFDLAFVNQRPAPWSNSTQNSPMLGSAGARRRSSDKSAAESVGSAELSSIPSGRRSGASSVAPHALDIARSRHDSRVYIGGPSTDPTSAQDYRQSAQDYLTFQESPMFASRHRHRYRHSREHSQASIATFSTHSMPANEQQTNHGMDNESGSGSGANRRRQRRRPFSTDFHDSSSGQSTPNHLLFARLRHKTSDSVKSVNAIAADSDMCHSPELLPRTLEGREYKGSLLQHMSASRQLGRSRRGIRTNIARQNDEEDGYSADVEADGGSEVLYLRFSTSVPDILVMPMVSNVGGQWRTIKRPDYSYERLLVMSRNTKVRRWKQRKPGLATINQPATYSLSLETTHRDDGIASHDNISPLVQCDIGRRATVGAATDGLSRSASRTCSAHQPVGYQSADTTVCSKQATSPSYATAANPADAVSWTDWTDDVKGASHSPAAQRAVATWHKISRAMGREHRRRQGSLRARQNSSGSYLSTSNLPRASMLFPATSIQGSAGAMDIAALPPSGGSVTAMLNPYLMEPTYLQRGVSESGRQVSPSSAFSSMYQMSNFGNLDSRYSPSMASVDAEAVQGPRLLEARGNAVTGPFGDNARGHAAPHRRLSIIKDQELGKSWGNLAGAGTSPPRLEKTSELAGMESGNSSSRISPSTVDKSPWIIARLDDPEEAIEMLQSFQSRLQQRLTKAKAESEQELVDIIQDLSEFVEEGLSYVNEDGAAYSPYGEDSAATEDYSSDASYVSDQDDEYAPSLEGISPLPLPLPLTTEHERAVCAAHHHHHSRSAGDQLACGGVTRPDESTVSVTARELKGLNKRLHDVLSLRSDSRGGQPGAARPASQPSGLQLQLAPSPPPPPGEVAAAGAGSASARLSPVQRLIRSPSIRRLAFLRALSGDRVNASAPASADDDNARSRIRHSAELPSALPLLGDAQLQLPEASLQQHLGFASESALHQAHSNRVPNIFVGHSSGLGAEPSPRASYSAPRITQDPLALWNDSQLGSTGRSASPQSEIPFPSLQPKSSMHSISSMNKLGTAASETSSLSGGSGGRYSSGVRSQSRSSMYSAGSRASLLASPLIAEDEFKPTPFLKAIIDLVTIIGHVVGLSASDMLQPLSGSLLEEASSHLAMPGASAEDARHLAMSLMPTAYVVQRLNELGHLWEQPPHTSEADDEMADQPWPCRGLFFRALLAISSLNRIVMWYTAVRTTYSEDIVAEVDRRVGGQERDLAVLSATGSSGGLFPSASPAGFSNTGALPFSGDGLSMAGTLTGRSSSVASMSTMGPSGQPGEANVSGNSWGATSYSVGCGNDESSTARPTWHHSFQTAYPPRPPGDIAASHSTAAVDKGLNMLMEITLDGRIRYISPTCQRLLGTKPEVLINQPASTIFAAESISVCRSAVEQLLTDSTRTVEINIEVHSPDLSRAAMVEAKGMLIYCRARNEPSHVMWVLRYAAASPPQQPVLEEPEAGQTSALPMPLFRPHADASAEGESSSALSLGIADIERMQLGHYKSLAAACGRELSGVVEEDEAAALSLSPVEYITCRICDRAIPAAYFEEHNWFCAQSHRAAMDIGQLNDRLGDIKTELQAWYPGCDFEELEDMVHGGTDVETLRKHAQQRASEVGHPAWQGLIDEASLSVKSMTKMCALALTLSEDDSAPKCVHPSVLGDLEAQVTGAELDFQRSDNWVSAARYDAPVSEYRDPALEALGQSLKRTIAAKMSAIDSLQYAIVEASLASSNWVLPDDSGLEPDLFMPSEYLRRSASAVEFSSPAAGRGTSELASYASTKDMDILVNRGTCTPEPQPTKELGSTGPCSESVDKASRLHAEVATGPRPKGGWPIATAFASRRTSSQPEIETPTARKASDSSLAARQASPLRISTANLHQVPGRASMGGSAFLATPTVPSIHDFVVLKPISKGAYGSVFLAKKRTIGEYYAIKILKKADMISKNQISNVKAERAIMMAQTGSPFVVRLLYTFQSRTNLYLVMEYLNGGDCAALLKAIGTLSEDWARSYLAEVVLGIEDLHTRNVVHRDLKPDNLLIDSEGHLKLTDFGLSKLGFLGRRVDQHAFSHPMSANESALLLDAQRGIMTSSSRVWQPFVSGSTRSARRDFTDNMAALDDDSSQPITPIRAVAAIPSIPTPPPMRSKDFSSLDAAAVDDCRHGSQAKLDSVQGKRVAALKGKLTLGHELGSGSSINALASSSASLSSSASASTSSDAYSHASAPKQQKHALGTPDYIAPESILGLESGKSVDWWALGIICYEFLFGIPPFHDETPEKVFSNILSADIDFYDGLREQLKRGNEGRRERSEHDADGGEHEDGDGCDEASVPDISPEVRDFITRLLCRDPTRRLGYNGAEEVKAHPIFTGIDWDTLLDTQPAFVPHVDNEEDTEYFDTRGATMDGSAHSQDNSDDDDGFKHPSDCLPGQGSAKAEPQQSPAAINVGPCRRSKVKATSKSHPHEASMLDLCAGVAMHRPRTLPLRLSELASGSRSTADAEQAEPAPNAMRLPQEASKDRGRHIDDLPALDEDPEFGGFTFKNLHALEQANMNELVKLRRRSTLLDMSTRPLARNEARSSLAPGLGTDNLPIPSTRRHHSALGSNSSSRNSMHLELSSPGPEGSMFGTRRVLSSDSGEHTDRLHPPFSAGVQLSRTRTISCFSPSHYGQVASTDGGESTRSGSGSHGGNLVRGRSISNSRDSLSIASSGSPATPGHARALSAHALTHRGSLLNPSTQMPTAPRNIQQQQPLVADTALLTLTSTPIPGKECLPPPSRLTRLASSLPRPEPAPALYERPSASVAPMAAPLQPDYLQSRICLVADDNPVCLKIMEIVLRRMHMECVVVRNGAEAIRCAMGRTVFRAIFMDTGMPIVDGDEATRMIKSTYNANKDTPVIAMAAYDGEATGSLYDDAIVKPVTLHRVKQSLR